MEWIPSDHELDEEGSGWEAREADSNAHGSWRTADESHDNDEGHGEDDDDEEDDPDYRDEPDEDDDDEFHGNFTLPSHSASSSKGAAWLNLVAFRRI